MFGIGKSEKIERAAKDAYENLESICRPYIANGVLVEAIETDPYVAGYMAGRLPCAVVLSSKEHGLDIQDAAHVVKLVQVQLYEMKALDIVTLSNDLRSEEDQDFIRGYKRAQSLQAYALHQRDIVGDPDFLEAMRVAKDMGLPQSNDMSVPMAGLEHLWFTKHMQQYL